MPNVNLTAPSDYGMQAAEIARQRKLADLLIQQASQPPETYQFGGMGGKMSWTQALAKALQGAVGGYKEYKAGEAQKQLSSDYAGAQQQDTATMIGAMKGVPERPAEVMPEGVAGPPQPGRAAIMAGQINPDAISQLKLPENRQLLRAEYLKQNAPYTLAPDATRMIGNTQVAHGAPRTVQDNSPEIIRLQNAAKNMLPTDPAYEQITARINHLTESASDKKVTWSEPYQLGGAWVQKDENGNIKQAVGREPQTHIYSPPAVTTSNVQDPSNPQQQLVVDARTYKGGTLGAPGVIGVSGKLGDAAKLENKRQFNMQGIGATIQEAENLLTNKAKPPTGSGVGTAMDYAASMIGASPAGSIEAQQLKAIGGALTAKMPRMEGPQSDRDTQLYKEMAGMVGNSMLPVDRRVAALEKVKDLWSKYERLNPGAFEGGGKQPQGAGGGWSIVR